MSAIVSLLATVTELEERLAAVRQALAEELAGRGRGRGQAQAQAIRLQPVPQERPSQGQRQRQERQQGQQGQQGQGQRQRPERQERPAVYRTIPLSEVLRNGEEVHIRLHLPQEDASLVCRFDGEILEVCGSEHVPSMIGLKSAKPGELVYRFMDELKAAGLLTRTFTVAPWRVCFVQRDGVEVTVESLRG
jgi:hypothetical protein